MYPQMNQNIMAMLGQNGGFSPINMGGMPSIRGTAMGNPSGFIPPPPPQQNQMGGMPQSPMVNMPMPPQTGAQQPQQMSQQPPMQSPGYSSFNPKSNFGMFR